MWRVIGGDGVDGAVDEARLDGGHVGVGSQRRMDLEHRVVGGTTAVGQGEVVRCRLGGDRMTGRLGRPHHLDATRGRQVLEVDPHPGEPGEGDVAHDHQLLGLRRLAAEPELGRPRTFVHDARPGTGR